MPDFTPADAQFLAWWTLYFSGRPRDVVTEARLAMHWSVSMETQQRLGEVPRPDLW
ncbi:hypothetical protein [Hydrocarboniclastica marina]|uniref:hypothetical protein n=1 Tax=Hydrocarboniclastica marina TaxID=2259620 RepID=UPI001561F544|nr:hypothetical protein [Hydrocarboniclastica marina]|tara:strand:+ start:8767 stop:8934 length:168 start_codon:yes stop_codon:yes gene_type:complete